MGEWEVVRTVETEIFLSLRSTQSRGGVGTYDRSRTSLRMDRRDVQSSMGFSREIFTVVEG